MLRIHGALVTVLALTGCWAGSDDRIPLSNGGGKDDSIKLKLKLTDSSPSVSFSVGCDQAHGCAGNVGIDLVTPEACALFPDEPRCGNAPTQPLGREVLTATVTTSTEGERRLPLRVESGDGLSFTTRIAAGFTATSGEELDVTIEKTPGTPDLLIEVGAEWVAKPDPAAAIAELKAFLATVPGLTATEIGTWMSGYRAFMLEYEQPIDHANPAAGTFKQRAVLHHYDKAAPLILYTSGYELFSQDDMSELGTALAANQLSTEQRWFGSSGPAEITPESWQYVTIEQAAKDHHRFVEVLRPFYTGAWLSTGHSKGGMTSIFHRRFFPEDVDATVAYVAPISFADPDPRYLPFLDQIGETECRNAIRGVQRRALEQFDQMFALAMSYQVGQTFERAGGPESAFEKSIVLLEWLYWQYYKASDCAPFLNAPTDVNGLFSLLSSYAGTGYPDSAVGPSQAYYYQAETQLGKQAFATAHLAGLLKYEATPFDWSPPGTNPVHSRAAMDDVQAWVKTQASEMLFLYGEYDPWTGGAYELATLPEVVRVTAPKSPHGALLADLTPADRDIALGKIATWIGTRPNISGGPMPRPAMPWRF